MGIIVISILIGGALIPATGFILQVLTGLLFGNTDSLFEGRGFIYLWISNSISIYLLMT